MIDGFNEDALARESGYAETMAGTILPYLAARECAETVAGDQGRPLYTVSYTAEQPAGTVLMVHGFTENAYKYAELIWSLLQNGMNVVIYDQRGHGRSWRQEGISDQSLTHVDDFNEYVRDMEAVVGKVLSRFPRPWMVFSHSMGGAVTGLYLERHQDTFERAAMSAPMIAPNRNGIPLTAGKLLCLSARLLGNGKGRLMMTRPYSGPEDFATSCATSRARFDWYDAVKQQHQEFQNNSPSYDWTMQSLKVTDLLLAPGAVEKIACPVRVYTAEDDHSVLPDAQAQFASRLAHGTRTLVLVKGARHEIYRSTDDVLYPWWHDVLTFLKTGS